MGRRGSGSGELAAGPRCTGIFNCVATVFANPCDCAVSCAEFVVISVSPLTPLAEFVVISVSPLTPLAEFVVISVRPPPLADAAVCRLGLELLN